MRYLGLSLTKARQLLEGCPGVTWAYVVAVDRDYREMRFEQLMRVRGGCPPRYVRGDYREMRFEQLMRLRKRRKAGR